MTLAVLYLYYMDQGCGGTMYEYCKKNKGMHQIAAEQRWATITEVTTPDKEGPWHNTSGTHTTSTANMCIMVEGKVSYTNLICR